MSPEEVTEAVTKYQEGSFMMNDELRQGTDISNLTRMSQQMARGMDIAVKEHHIPEGQKLYRGISRDNAPEFKVGSYVIDKGFVSTSKDSWQAESFVSDYEGPGKTVLLEIRLPQGGVKALDMNKKIPDSSYDYQQEVVLARGSRFYIESNKMHQGVQLVKVLLMP
jgi:hypothetical protein